MHTSRKKSSFFSKNSIFCSVLPFQRTNEIFIALVNKSRKRLRMRDERNVWRTVGAANFSRKPERLYVLSHRSASTFAIDRRVFAKLRGTTEKPVKQSIIDKKRLYVNRRINTEIILIYSIEISLNSPNFESTIINSIYKMQNHEIIESNRSANIYRKKKGRSKCLSNILTSRNADSFIRLLFQQESHFLSMRR